MDPQSSFNQANQQGEFSYREKHTHRHDVLERIIWIAGSFLLAMLGIRFVFSLLGANPDNGFASFVYGFTAPFTSPFYNLFSYDHPSLGMATFEGYTLVSMVIYSLAIAGLARLVSITRY
jgi:YggT family protein